MSNREFLGVWRVGDREFCAVVHPVMKGYKRLDSTMPRVRQLRCLTVSENKMRLDV
jgi:hypothetical protein